MWIHDHGAVSLLHGFAVMLLLRTAIIIMRALQEILGSIGRPRRVTWQLFGAVVSSLDHFFTELSLSSRYIALVRLRKVKTVRSSLQVRRAREGN